MPSEIADTSGVVSLEEYRAAAVWTPKRWVDSLPEEIQAQILASTAGSTIVSRWLKESLGYTGATANRVNTLIKERDTP
jgi:hypothetical protein